MNNPRSITPSLSIKTSYLRATSLMKSAAADSPVHQGRSFLSEFQSTPCGYVQNRSSRRALPRQILELLKAVVHGDDFSWADESEVRWIEEHHQPLSSIVGQFYTFLQRLHVLVQTYRSLELDIPTLTALKPLLVLFPWLKNHLGLYYWLRGLSNSLQGRMFQYCIPSVNGHMQSRESMTSSERMALYGSQADVEEWTLITFWSTTFWSELLNEIRNLRIQSQPPRIVTTWAPFARRRNVAGTTFEVAQHLPEIFGRMRKT